MKKLLLIAVILAAPQMQAMEPSEQLKRQIREAEEEASYIRSYGLNHIESYRELLESDERFLKGIEEELLQQRSDEHDDSASSCVNQESASIIGASSEKESWSFVQEDSEKEDDWSVLEAGSHDSWDDLKDDKDQQ